MKKSLSLYIREFSADFLHKDGQIVELVLVDVEGGHAGHVGELDVRRVVVSVQNERAELLQLTQQSRVPVRNRVKERRGGSRQAWHPGGQTSTLKTSNLKLMGQC